MKRVYLAGLISTEAPESLLWRERVAQAITLRKHVQIVTPLRDKKDLMEKSKDGGITDSRLTPGDIVKRDYTDVILADVILANLNTWGSKRPMVGTLAELAWAWDHKKPVVAICDKDDYLMRNHPFVKEFVTHYCETEDEAVGHLVRYWL